jgi:hypothetical protein
MNNTQSWSAMEAVAFWIIIFGTVAFGLTVRAIIKERKKK